MELLVEQHAPSEKARQEKPKHVKRTLPAKQEAEAKEIIAKWTDMEYEDVKSHRGTMTDGIRKRLEEVRTIYGTFDPMGAKRHMEFLAQKEKDYQARRKIKQEEKNERDRKKANDWKTILKNNWKTTYNGQWQNNNTNKKKRKNDKRNNKQTGFWNAAV